MSKLSIDIRNKLIDRLTSYLSIDMVEQDWTSRHEWTQLVFREGHTGLLQNTDEELVDCARQLMVYQDDEDADKDDLALVKEAEAQLAIEEILSDKISNSKLLSDLRRAYVKVLHKHNKVYHFDDAADEICTVTSKDPLEYVKTFTTEEAKVLDQLTQALHHEELFEHAIEFTK